MLWQDTNDQKYYSLQPCIGIWLVAMCRACDEAGVLPAGGEAVFEECGISTATGVFAATGGEERSAEAVLDVVRAETADAAAAAEEDRGAQPELDPGAALEPVGPAAVVQAEPPEELAVPEPAAAAGVLPDAEGAAAEREPAAADQPELKYFFE